jgi:hypothetical protein
LWLELHATNRDTLDPDPIMNIEESRISHRVRYAEMV